MSADLAGRTDLKTLLRHFYGRALDDPLLRPVFVDVAQMDLEEHLPRIVAFWDKVLFNAGGYDGRVMQVHQHLHEQLPLTGAHFERWLVLWRESLDALFAGPVVEQADAHARRMATTFLRNLQAPQPRRSLSVVPLRS